MIYTTYISKYLKLFDSNKLPDNTLFCLVMRYVPKWLDVKKYNLRILKSLSPSNSLINRYLEKSISWDNYVILFNNEIETNMMDTINFITERLNKNPDRSICFICCEKDYLHCHRTLLANYFKSIGFRIKEL